MEKKPLNKDLNALFTLLLPIVYIILGALLLFVPDINTKVLSELFGAALAITGSAMIIRYFLNRSYLDMRAYGFSLGTLAVILGVCIIVRADAITSSFCSVLDIGIMLTAIVKLQNSIQLKFLKNVLWIPVLCVSLVFLICTILIFINPFTEEVRNTFTYITLLCDGIASFANVLILRITTRRLEKGKTQSVQPV